MTGPSRYVPPELSHWQGRADLPPASCFFQIIQPLNLQQSLPDKSPTAFGLIGFCCDEGIRRNFGRTGAAEGPFAIRQALAKMPVQRNTLIYDAGDITCTDGDLESAQLALADAVSRLLEHGITPIVLGGGHELAWGHYQGIAQQFSRGNLGIINFDAHFDMRPLLPQQQGSSGTPFLQIAKAHQKDHRRFDYNCIGIQPAGNIPALFATAKDHGAHILLAEEVYQGDIKKRESFIERVIKENPLLYVSLCLDVFASAYAPGVSAPQSLGLTPWQIIPYIRRLAQSGQVVSYDLAELSPKYDIDQRTAKLAANFIYEMIHHHDFKRTHYAK